MRRTPLGRLMGLVVVALVFLPAVRDARATDAPKDVEAGFDNVEVIDPGLGGRLSVVSVGSDRTKTDLLSIFASLKNLTARALRLEVETLYKDGDGKWLDGGRASWLLLEIKPHEEMEYRSASLSEEAQDFLVRIRQPEEKP